MSVPDHLLDQPVDRACLTCVLRELAASMAYRMEESGVPIKYAQEIADEAVSEARAHFDTSEYRTCADCAFKD